MVYLRINQKIIRENLKLLYILYLIEYNLLCLFCIPEFIKKIVFYEESKIFMYFGKYYLNEIYNINDFISNKNLFFYKVMEYKKDIKDYIHYNPLLLIYI